MELLKGPRDVVFVEVDLVGVLLLSLFVLVSVASTRGSIRGAVVLARGLDLDGDGILAASLALALVEARDLLGGDLGQLGVIVVLEFEQLVHQQMHVLHRLNVETLADSVDFDGELLFLRAALALLVRFVVHEEGSVLDQELEYILDSLVLVPRRVLVARRFRLVVHQLILALSLGTALAIHDRGVLVHRVAVGLRVGAAVA